MPPSPTTLAHLILRDVVCPGDLAIDATAGNGHDTVFLAECVGVGGRVLAFDVQATAIASARARVAAAGFESKVDFFQESHADMNEHAADGSVAVVMFNLGYLPGEDHQVMTETATTLEGLNRAVQLLKKGGVLSVLCYPGHAAGAQESMAVEEWFTALTAHGWRVARYAPMGTLRPAPFLLLGSRVGSIS